MKLEDLLKSKGWTDADLEAVKPMLSNERFRATLEEQYGALATERDQLQTVNAEWQRKLEEDYNPRMTAAEKEAQQARLDLAQANEKLKIAKDYGYLPDEAAAKVEVAAAQAKVDQTANYDAKRHPSWEDVNRFADVEGDVIMMSHDLAAEYAFLTGGKSLFEYEGSDGQRGMRALRREAKAARQDFDKFIQNKFDFAGKRAAKAQEKQKEHDDAIRKEEADRVRTEMASQYGNPLLRTPMPSRAPFIPGTPTGGKQPWETSKQERRATRLTHLAEVQAKAGVVN